MGQGSRQDVRTTRLASLYDLASAGYEILDISVIARNTIAS